MAVLVSPVTDGTRNSLVRAVRNISLLVAVTVAWIAIFDPELLGQPKSQAPAAIQAGDREVQTAPVFATVPRMK